MVNFDELVSGFSRVGLESGDTVLVHSSFKSFGGVEGGPETVIRALLEVLGKDGTLVMPTFTFSFCEEFNKTGKGHFDVKEMPSKMGIMTEMVRKMPGSLRSINPIYSVAVYGKRASLLAEVTDKNVFGRSSIFGKLYDLGGKIMAIGLKYNDSMTFFHYIEQMEGCDYRYAKNFSGQIKASGKTYDDTFTMSVRHEGIVTDVNPMGEVLEKNGIIKKTMIGLAEIKLMDARAVYEVTAREMKKNPHLLYSEIAKK
jgi:aminoglycoside 3-N-acetyltransferase